MLFERQQYQEDCVHSILSVLQNTHSTRDFSREALRALHQRNGIQETKIVDARRLDVLMETGTGKTFTYIKTMYEMHKRFGIKKFVVFVPRIAIRAGVVQNVDLTADYFWQEYGVRIKKHTYGDKGGLGQVLNFVRNENDFSVLILTSASITGKNQSDRILTSRSEDLLYAQKSPLDAISGLNPVVFIDEPHLLKGAGFLESYNRHFNDTLCIRFGATFPTGKDEPLLANVVYALDSLTSFREYLVKKIRVSTLVDGDSSIKFYRPTERARGYIDISYFQDNVEHRRTVRYGDNLAGITNDANYDFSVVRVTGDDVHLSNRTKRKLSKNDYALADDSIRQMVHKTIAMHFEKEAELFRRNIKTLSLFFIPNIDDFRGENARIKKIFDEEYKRLRNEVLRGDLSAAYRAYLEKDYDADGRLCVREGYFSGDRGTLADREAQGVDLILNQKSKLLSTAEPLRFIFSVWALQEGWDNPNVFNICKLAPTDRETSRRQQVGRGLRLAVDNLGKRQTINHCGETEGGFYAINILDVMVSAHEQNFIEEIQNEIIGASLTDKRLTRRALQKLKLTDMQINRLMVVLADANVVHEFPESPGIYEIISPVADFLDANRDELHPTLIEICEMLIAKFEDAAALPVENRNKPSEKVGIRAERFAEFEALWKTITAKAKLIYRGIDDDVLIGKIKAAFDDETVHPLMTKVVTQTYNHETNTIITKESEYGAVHFFNSRNQSGDAIQGYAKFIADFSTREKLPLQLCVKLFNALDKDKIAVNPGEASELLSKILQDAVHETVVQKIGYQFDGEIAIDARNIFYQDDECKTPRSEIDAGKIGRYIDRETVPSERYLYDRLVYDSGIERKVVRGDDEGASAEKIVVFAKLPKISIPTPYKSYSPDFAYFVRGESGNNVFLIVETKGYNRTAQVPDEDMRKTKYAEKFFAELDRRTPSVQVVFRRRLNRDSFSSLLREIGGVA